MISNCSLKSAPQGGIGTEVPTPMADLLEQESPVVLLDGKDFLAKLARVIHSPIAEESESRRTPSGL